MTKAPALLFEPAQRKKIEGEGAGSSGKQAHTCQHRRPWDAPQQPGTRAAGRGGAQHKMGLTLPFNAASQQRRSHPCMGTEAAAGERAGQIAEGCPDILDFSRDEAGVMGVGKRIRWREHCLDRPLALQWAFILLSQSFQLCLELLVLAAGESGLWH